MRHVMDASRTHGGARLVVLPVVLDQVGDGVVARRRQPRVEVDRCERATQPASAREVEELRKEERDASARSAQRARLEELLLEISRRLPRPTRASHTIKELDRDGRAVEGDGGVQDREPGVLLEPVPAIEESTA